MPDDPELAVRVLSESLNGPFQRKFGAGSHALTEQRQKAMLGMP